MAKPHRYVLGTTPEITLTPLDDDGVFFTPVLVRLSIKEPSGTIITYSGADLSTGSGYLYTIYNPPLVGGYEYEGWVRDGAGREKATTATFEVYDRLY